MLKHVLKMYVIINVFINRPGVTLLKAMNEISQRVVIYYYCTQKYTHSRKNGVSLSKRMSRNDVISGKRLDPR